MTIYHYTSIQNLSNIIESRQIWLSNVEYLNDNMECRVGIDEILDIVSKKVGKGVFTEVLREQFLKKILPKIFSASFSRKGDLLGQWRAYCPKDSGVALGFDEKSLFPDVKMAAHMISECVYGDHSGFVESKIKPTIDSVDFSVFDEMKNFTTYNEDDVDRLADKVVLVAHDMTAILAAALPQLKHGSFSDEREVRVIQYEEDKDKIHYRTSGEIFIPFIKKEFLCEDGLICSLTDIVVGPGKNQLRNSRSIAGYMKSKGYENIRITISECPLI